MKNTPQRLLQIIYYLSKKNKAVKSIEVGKALGISRTEVFRTLKVLKEDGYVDQQPYGKIQLTARGKIKSEHMIKVHAIMTNFFMDKLGLSASEAVESAHEIESSLNPTLIKKIIEKGDER